MKVKEESQKTGLKLNIQKTKIMALLRNSLLLPSGDFQEIRSLSFPTKRSPIESLPNSAFAHCLLLLLAFVSLPELKWLRINTLAVHDHISVSCNEKEGQEEKPDNSSIVTS